MRGKTFSQTYQTNMLQFNVLFYTRKYLPNSEEMLLKLFDHIGLQWSDQSSHIDSQADLLSRNTSHLADR